VTRLFDSFEITDAGGPDPTPAPNPPAPPVRPGGFTTPEPPRPPSPPAAQVADLTLPAGRDRVNDLRSGILGPAFDPDGKTLAFGTPYGTAVWFDTATGMVVATRPTRQGGAKSGAAASPQGDRVAFFADGGKLVVAGREDETLLQPARAGIATATAGAFSPDGKQVCTVHHGGVVQVWDLDGEGPAKELTGGDPQARVVAYSGDGKYLVTAGGDVRLYTADTLRPVAASRPVGKGAYNAVAVDPAGRRVAAVNDEDGVTVWDLAGAAGGGVSFPPRSRLVRRHDFRQVTPAVWFTPDGRHLLVRMGVKAGSGQVLVLDAAAGTQRAELTLLQFDRTALLAVSPTGNRVAVTTAGRVRLLDPAKFGP
jgi:DNA-binding beta-propeller fold protein YncE